MNIMVFVQDGGVVEVISDVPIDNVVVVDFDNRGAEYDGRDCSISGTDYSEDEDRVDEILDMFLNMTYND